MFNHFQTVSHCLSNCVYYRNLVSISNTFSSTVSLVIACFLFPGLNLMMALPERTIRYSYGRSGLGQRHTQRTSIVQRTIASRVCTACRLRTDGGAFKRVNTEHITMVYRRSRLPYIATAIRLQLISAIQNHIEILHVYQNVLWRIDERRRRRRRIIVWVQPRISRRPQLGVYDRLMVELRAGDPASCRIS